MDPNANLNEQRSLARDVMRTEEGDSVNGFRLAELVIALDEWRSSGGFDPYTDEAHNVYVVLAGTSPMVFLSEDDANAYAEASGNEPVHACAVRDHDDATELLDEYKGDDDDEDEFFGPVPDNEPSPDPDWMNP